MMKRKMWIFGVICTAAVAAFGAIKDVDGNAVTPSTPFGNVDGETGTVGELVSQGGGKSSDGAARPLPPYLHALSFDSAYPEDAAWYYSLPQDYGQCSAVRRGNLLYRNYDWKFDDAAEFVVKVTAGPGRFASVGVANVGTNLTEAFVTGGKWSRFYKALPGHTVDGVNERGVVAEVNVVDGAWPRTSGEIHCLGAVRWALDNATSAGMAASNLAAKVYVPQGMGNFHWMLADERETWIVENGTASNVTDVAAKRVMTNFLILNDAYAGSGKERYDLLFGGANVTNAWFTRCYSAATSPKWTSEFGGDEAALDAAVAAWNEGGRTKESHRGEALPGGETWWQTVHTSIYDITNRTLKIAVQEIDDWYEFAVPSGGGAKPEDVRGIVEPMIVSATNATLQAANAYTDAHSGGITTNDVCNIVTNEVEVFTEWTFEPQFLGTQKISLYYYEYEDIWRPMLDGAPKGNKDSTVLAWGEEEWPGGVAFTARRLKVKRNALGLVHKDTPTPQVKFAGGATNYVLVVEDGKLNLYAETPDEN